MSTICLDTQIIYWGLVGRAPSAQQQHLIEHAFFLEQISQAWMLADYNAQAARWFARIRRATQTQKHIRALQQQGASRKELVADVMIIATALAHHADVLYSHDNRLRHLAAKWLETQSLTPPPTNG